jgi:hypothetical protein
LQQGREAANNSIAKVFSVETFQQNCRKELNEMRFY